MLERWLFLVLALLRCWHFNSTVAEMAIRSMELGVGTEAVFAQRQSSYWTLPERAQKRIGSSVSPAADFSYTVSERMWFRLSHSRPSRNLMFRSQESSVQPSVPDSTVVSTHNKILEASLGLTKDLSSS